MPHYVSLNIHRTCPCVLPVQPSLSISPWFPFFPPWVSTYSHLVKYRWISDYPHSQTLWLVLTAQSCLTLCNPINCSPPSSSIHGILQARTLEWIAIPFSRGSSQPRDWTRVFCIAGRFFTVWAFCLFYIDVRLGKWC